MAHAMEPIAECSILREHKTLTFRAGRYSYRIDREGDDSIYTVSDGSENLNAQLRYAFGLGKAGQTYVFEHGGRLYESRVSFYTALNGLDLTVGAANMEPRGLEEAAGRLMDRRDAQDCFGCHTTGSPAPGTLQSAMTPGVTCEHCHGSALAHVDGFRNGRPVAMKKLSAMTTEEMSDFCGQCHRTWAQIAANGPHNVNNVRFQPYRLANSKCYDASDLRIRCVACHNPHQEVIDSGFAYDRNCLACHAPGQKASALKCPAANRNCVSCHMPKIELPGSHHLFTDHNIRLVKIGATYPP